MRAFLAVVVSVALLALGAPARAHGGSYDLKYVDGSNLILLTLNTHEPAAGLEIEHNLRLYDLVGAPIPYDEVRIELHTQEDFDDPVDIRSSLLTEETLPMLPTNESKVDLKYPHTGAHSLVAEFRAAGQPVSRAEFALDVAEGSSGPSGLGLGQFAVGLLVGATIALLLVRRRRRDTDSERPSATPAPLTERTRVPS